MTPSTPFHALPQASHAPSSGAPPLDEQMTSVYGNDEVDDDCETQVDEAMQMQA